MSKILQKIKSFFEEFRLLLNNVPSLLVALFAASVVGMNLLANKSINTGLDWLALDCGIILSWVPFMCMDILTKRYGPKAATYISILALLINLFFALIFFVAAVIPGIWSQSYVDGSESIINASIDGTFKGTWYVLLGSSIAFIVSAIVNNVLNWTIGKAFKKKPNSFGAFVCRAYVSTMIGQFTDNLLFALIVSHVFFGWNIVQCLTCAATGAIFELLLEVIFSPIGYKISNKLADKGVGDEYLKYVEERKSKQ